MYTFYYHNSCPLSRQVKVLLKYLSIEHKCIIGEYWLPNNVMFDLSPNGNVPILKSDNVGIIDGVFPIVEYLMHIHPDFHLFEKDIILLNEVRRLFSLINEKLNYDVTKKVVLEKLVKFLDNSKSPNRSKLKKAQKKQKEYLEYFNEIIKERGFVFRERVSLLDIALASHISILDYFSLIDWYLYSVLRSWYQVMKSLPYFRVILKERLGTFIPPKHYQELDF